MALASADELILAELAKGTESLDTWAFAQATGLEHDAVVGATKSLVSDGYVAAEPRVAEWTQLTAEGESYVSTGSPELQVLRALSGEMTQEELQTAVGAGLFKIGFAACMKNKWVAMDKATKRVRRVVSRSRTAAAAPVTRRRSRPSPAMSSSCS
jgi:hypothetical protein